MAKTSYITIPAGFDLQYKKVIKSGDRFITPRISVNRIFNSRAKKKGITQRSMFVELSSAWQGFSQATRDAWDLAGAVSNMSGWKLFVQDTTNRRKMDLAGYATPDVIYQSKVGRITIDPPATGLTIVQLHPQSYFVNKKVTGTRSQYEPKLISENLSLPIDISISYKADLKAIDSSAYAKFYVIVYSNYQGRDIENVCEIPFNLSNSWASLTSRISSVIGVFRGYTAFIQIHNARGTLLFDNVKIIHSSLNWARDPYCNYIERSFTKAFYQIPRNWGVEEIIEGAQYGSIYHTF